MPPRLLLCLLLASCAAVTAQSKRIFTNPRPEGHFKTLFPNAGGFSSFGGTPLHWKVYAADPKTNPAAPPIGYIFWTTDLVPNERAYHGPIHMLVGMDTRGILQGVVVDYNSEPYGYTRRDRDAAGSRCRRYCRRARFPRRPTAALLRRTT